MSIKIIEGIISLLRHDLALRWRASTASSLIGCWKGPWMRCKKHGVMERDITVVKVPGAYELPLAVKMMLDQNSYDGIIALGAVIRGGTPHFEYVAGECVKGSARSASMRLCR